MTEGGAHPARVAIVGASAAGVSAARTLRAEGFRGGLRLIDADPNLPYERPPLSKQVLERPEAGPEDFLLLGAEEAAELGIELVLGRRVVALDAEAIFLTLQDGEQIGADAILLATGGQARRLKVPGAELEGVHVMRTFADAEALRRAVKPGSAVAVVGGGLIGAEACVALTRRGCQVLWLDAADAPLVHILPSAIANHLVADHVAAGVRLIAKADLSHFIGRDGKVCGIGLRSGDVLQVDAVLLGVGMAPDDALARAAGLEVSTGVHVDEAYRTSAKGVYAAGDVAAFQDEASGDRRRHEHWRAAEEQGANAARSILGLPISPPSLSWFWSDQGAHHVEMAGRRGAESVLRPGASGPISFEFDGDRLVGVASVNEPNAVRIGVRLIQRVVRVDPAALADPAVDLRKLLTTGAA